MKRYTLTLKIFLVLLAIPAFMMILIAWRLSIGPIALDWAGDYLKKALEVSEEGTVVDFREAVLTWSKADRFNAVGKNGAHLESNGLKIIFYNLEYTNHNTDFFLNAPKVGVQLSGLALLRGLLAPTDIEISGLTIDYTLDPKIWEITDSRPFMERLELFAENLQASKNLPIEIARQLLSPPKSSATAGYLRHISLLNTNINLTDQLSGHKWKIPDTDLSLGRTDFGLDVYIIGDVHATPTNIIPINIMLAFDNKNKNAVIKLRFSGLRPSALAGNIEAMESFANLDIPASGAIKFTIDHHFEIPKVTFALSLGKGNINPAKIYSKPLHITSASLNGYISKHENSVVLDEMSLRLGQTYIRGSGLLYGTLDKPGINLKANITDLPFLDLKLYWPEKFGAGAYDWIVKNIEGGIVSKGVLKVAITPEMWSDQRDSTTWPNDTVNFHFDFENIKAHYLRPMPPLTDISGQAELNLHDFHMIAINGKIDQLRVKEANLLFSDIDVHDGGIADITLVIDGKVEEILRVIDYEPLGYPSKYGIKAGRITGDAAATVWLKFPLLKKVRLQDVSFGIKADINHLMIPKLTDGLAINDGKMQMSVDDSSLTAKGNIVLNGVNFGVDWTEKFDRSEELPTKYTLNGFIEGAQWEQLHLPFEPYIEGPVEIDLALYGKGGALVKGNGKFNLVNSVDTFTPIGWKKEKGKAGLVDFDLNFKNPDKIEIRNILLQSAALQAKFEVDLVEGWVNRFYIPTLTMKDTNMTMLMVWNDRKKYYSAAITGKSFNSASLIKMITAIKGNNDEVHLPDFNVNAKIDDLLTRNNVRLKYGRLSAIYRNQNFTHIIFNGNLKENKGVKITVSPEGKNRKLTFTSGNAGEALRGLGMFNLGIHGEMLLNAEIVNQEFGASLGGHAKITNFKVIESPQFSKLLAEKNFLKAQQELKKGGLTFKEFEMDFRTYNGIMEINKGRAHGSMLGITVEGTVDQAYDEISLSGTIIPVYGINSLLGNIPLLGTILTGGKGQGVFAATYQISGILDNPEVTINPLSALAPGILRRIFSAIGGKKKTLREHAEEIQAIHPDKRPNLENSPEKKSVDKK